MIAGFDRPTLGRVRIANVDVTERPAYMRNVSTVFQNYALFPHMSVQDNVAYPLKMRRVGKKAIKSRVLEELELVSMSGSGFRISFQVGSGNALRLPGRLSRVRRSCCSTNRLERSTSSCARACC